MCATCGCDSHEEHEHDHDHDHDHDHHDHDHDHHDHHHHHHTPRAVTLEAQLLEKNAAYAAQNRAWLAARDIRAFNLMSSPGAGKTTLLERLLRDRAGDDTRALAVIEGDQETARDADRIRAAGARAVQINTGTGCHLDARMVAGALDELALPARSFLFIENVGNLVCPALFDLGEHARVVITSVTEGDDKPLKYPHMFRVADVVVLNKIDLLPHVTFDPVRFVEHARRINPRVEVVSTSATRGDGLEAWYRWLES